MNIDNEISGQPGGGAGASPPGVGGGGKAPPRAGPRGPASPIEFRLDAASGVPTYLQLVHQVEHALRLGYLKPGDQLPKVRDVVAGAGLDADGIVALFTSALRDFYERRSGSGDRGGAVSGETEGAA